MVKEIQKFSFNDKSEIICNLVVTFSKKSEYDIITDI